VVTHPKTLREIITLAWTAAGNRGQPTVAFVKTWRREHGEMGRWGLGVLFQSGSEFPCGIRDSLAEATEVWKRRHPGVSPVLNPEFEALYAEVKSANDALEAATAPPELRESRERHAEGMKCARAEAAKYQQARNAEEVAKGNPPPFEEWWLEE
jgi:hypothetical protein